MADKGYIRTLVSNLPNGGTLFKAFEHLSDNLRFGRADHQERAVNHQLYFANSTTPATANEEFSVLHGMGIAPYLALQVLPLDSSNTRTVRLHTTRPADSQRVYLSSPDTSASITLLLEG